MNATEDFSIIVRNARRDVERAKMLFANNQGTYDEMAEAAKRLSSALFDYETAKYPGRKARRIPYQAILR